MAEKSPDPERPHAHNILVVRRRRRQLHVCLLTSSKIYRHSSHASILDFTSLLLYYRHFHQFPATMDDLLVPTMLAVLAGSLKLPAS